MGGKWTRGWVDRTLRGVQGTGMRALRARGFGEGDAIAAAALPPRNEAGRGLTGYRTPATFPGLLQEP